MAWTKEDRSFKTLINRRTTDSTGKFWYNEVSDNTINVHSSEIWSDTINTDPAQAVTGGVAEHRVLFTLTLDSTVPSQQCYYAYESGNRLKDWISTKYGDDYLVHLYDNNNAEIFPTDASQWFFDYQTGILTFNAATTAFAKPFKISAYRYIGNKGGGSGTSGTSGTSGSGTSGTSGVDGTSGSSGTSGIDGVSGTSGTSGNGTSGTSGSSGISGLSYYAARTVSGEEVNVCATGLGITCSRTGSTFTFSIPAGVHILSATLRLAGAQTTTGTITVDTGQNATSWVDRIIMTCVKNWREDVGNQTSITTSDPTLTLRSWQISGLSTTAMNTTHIIFHHPVAA
jgi:hypothetical protein